LTNTYLGRGHHQASDFNDTFSGLIASFNEHKDSATNAMWNSQIERFDDFGGKELLPGANNSLSNANPL
jgi:hypothetical protein